MGDQTIPYEALPSLQFIYSGIVLCNELIIFDDVVGRDIRGTNHTVFQLDNSEMMTAIWGLKPNERDFVDIVKCIS